VAKKSPRETSEMFSSIAHLSVKSVGGFSVLLASGQLMEGICHKKLLGICFFIFSNQASFQMIVHVI
jgi:hypothetical protein